MAMFTDQHEPVELLLCLHELQSDFRRKRVVSNRSKVLLRTQSDEAGADCLFFSVFVKCRT